MSLSQSENDAEKEVALRLVERHGSLAIVETSAGGVVSARLTAIPGSSAWFAGGAVVYSAAARSGWLGVGVEATSAPGVVSGETALALARAARASLGTTWAAAETGIAGPQTGRRSAKPVGLVYVAVVGEIDGRSIERVAEAETGLDEREANRAAFADALLGLLLACLAEA